MGLKEKIRLTWRTLIWIVGGLALASAIKKEWRKRNGNSDCQEEETEEKGEEDAEQIQDL